MVSTSLSHPAAGPPGVQNEKCILYKYTKTDKSTSTGERLRLAKTYKLKENEDSAGLNQDGELIVINKEGNFEKLLHRLMRYSSDCELVSPKFLRNEMIKMINDTIENY